MVKDKSAAIRKRQQIDSSKRTMFIAVAVAAFVSGTAIVVSAFLVQQIAFHTKIIGAKQETIDTLSHNISAIDELKDNVRVLDTNQNLKSVKIKEGSSALQSILDALPSEPNADALGASLQNKFVGSVGGLNIESLTVDSIDGGYGVDAGDSGGASIGFQMSVSGSPDGLKELLTRFERSIRVIDLTSVEVQAGEGSLTLKISGQAYYEPARVIELGTKVIKP